MRPSDNLWSAYLAEIHRLREDGRLKDDDYYVLRHSMAAKASLMDLAKGKNIAITDGTIREILAAAKGMIRSDLVDELDTERAKRSTAEQTAAGDRLARIELERQQALSARKLRERSRWIAAILVRPLRWILGGALVVGSWWAWPSPAASGVRSAAGYAATVIQMLLLVLGVVGQRQVVMATVERTEATVAARIESWLRRSLLSD